MSEELESTASSEEAQMTRGLLPWTGQGTVITGPAPETILVANFARGKLDEVMRYHAKTEDWYISSLSSGNFGWVHIGNTKGVFQGPVVTAWFDNFGAGTRDLLVYDQGNRNWWLGLYDEVGARLNWFLAANTLSFGDIMDGNHVFWHGDFNGDHVAEVLFYNKVDHNWWLGTINQARLTWTLVGNTKGFGNLLDLKHSLHHGDFDGDGEVEILFYYGVDHNWWLGKYDGGQLNWKKVGNTAGFGDLTDDKHRLWRGRFGSRDRTQILFHYNGDGNWWLGTYESGALTFRLISRTPGFGDLFDGKHRVWTFDIDRDGLTEVLFHYNVDGAWWLGSKHENIREVIWRKIGDTRGRDSTNDFGDLLDIQHSIWTGDFTGQYGGILFHYNGDGKWWLGKYDGQSLTWQEVLGRIVTP